MHRFAKIWNSVSITQLDGIQAENVLLSLGFFKREKNGVRNNKERMNRFEGVM